MGIYKKIDKPLFWTTTFMFIFGLIMIFSASYVKAINVIDNAYYYLIRQGVILILCFFMSLVLIKFPIKLYKNLYKVIVIVCIALLIAVYVWGNISHGARSWFALPFFNLQPSELVKIGLILFLAAYYDVNREKNTNYKVTLFPYIFVIICFGLIVMQPDLGSALIVLFISIIMYFGVPLLPEAKKSTRKVIMIFTTISIILGTILISSGKIHLFEYQMQRFNFLKPCARYTEVGTGYQVCNSYIAINNGGLFGVGIGNSTQKYLYLPEAYTDFIYPVIIEELGIITGIIIMLLYGFVLFRILKIAKESFNLMNGLICYGVAVYIFVHIFVNLTGVLGLLPLTGVPLPFLSYGGSYAISLSIALTLVQRVKIETYNQIQKEKLK